VSADAAGAHTIASAVALDDAQEWENLSAVNFSVNGVVSGSNPLRKKGLGTVRLMNTANTLDGGIWIDEGVLYCNGVQGFGLGPINVGTNAQFAVNGPASAYTYFTPMTVNVYGAGNSWTNPSIIKSSGGRWGATVHLYTNAGVNIPSGYGNGCVFDLHGHTLYFDGSLQMESGSILNGTKTDGDGALYIRSGLFQIAGHSTLTGSVTVNSNSTLRLLAGASLPAGGVLYFGTNALFDQKTTSDGPFRNYKHTEIAGTLRLGGGRGRPYMYGTVDLLGGIRELHTSDSSSYDISVYFFNSISNGGIIKTGRNNLYLKGTNTYDLGLSVYSGLVYSASYGLPGSVYLSNECAVILDQAVTGLLSGPVSGLGSVVKLGIGEVVVTGNNSYSGGTYISNGVWIIEHANALGTVAAGTVISDGATLGIQDGIVIAAEPLTLSGNGYGALGALRNISGDNTFSGPITLLAHTRLRSDEGELVLDNDFTGDGFNLEVAGAGCVRIEGSLDLLATGAVSMAGSGFLFLGGESTNSGGAVVSSGTLVQNGTNTMAPMDVSVGATLMGCGSAGAADVSGTLCPGADTNSMDALAISSLTMRDGSSLQIMIGDCDDTTDRGYIVNGSAPTIESTTLVKPDSSLVSNWDASASNDWTIISGNIASTSGFSIDTSLWDTGTYDLNSGTFGLAENGGNLVLHFAPAPPVDIDVLGTNLALIADGDASPQEADGTDFGSVVAARDTKDHTFYITNSGLAALTISSVTTAGTHMAEFIILEWPTVVSAGGEASNLVVRFEPSASGVRTATLHVNNSDGDEADYDFAVQGTGVDLVGPYVTNFVAGVTNQVTDGQMTSGVFTITMNICDADGINTTDSSAPHFIPYFSIWNPVGIQVLTDEVFSAFTHAASGQEIEATDTTHAGVNYADNILGTFTNWFSAENSNDVTTVDLADDTDGNPLTFTVVDDDTEPPVMGHFASNFLANAGFETGDISGWGSWGSGFDVSGDAADSGDYGLWITNFNGGVGGSSSALIQHRTLQPSTTYRMFCRARKVGAMDPVAVEIKARRENSDWSAGLEIATNNFVAELTTDWQTFTMTFTTHASDTNYGCFVHVWNNEIGSYEGRAEFDAFYVGLADDPAPMQVIMSSTRINCTNQAVFGTTNAVYTVTDRQLLTSYYKYFKFAVYDEGSGLSRGTSDHSTQMNITFYNPVSGGFWHPTNCSYYYSSQSSPDSATLNDGATNTWRIWSGYPTYDQTRDMIGTNQVLVNVPDADTDRPGDRLWLTNAQFGLLEVVDDDVEPPQVTSNVFGRPLGVAIGTNWYTPVPDVDTTNAVFY
ncbi:MAG: choice-of-anchor D domain-containing protein, partial [Spartobacteria bacterium]|nr:choice-of-anchor D domain-containing protein [Spartobacteria bacterium]